MQWNKYYTTSKIVTQSENQANIPFKLTVENVNISESTTLEFSGTASDNTCGLRLFSVKLYVPGSGSTGGDGGTTIEPTPSN